MAVMLALLSFWVARGLASPGVTICGATLVTCAHRVRNLWPKAVLSVHLLALERGPSLACVDQGEMLGEAASEWP